MLLTPSLGFGALSRPTLPYHCRAFRRFSRGLSPSPAHSKETRETQPTRSSRRKCAYQSRGAFRARLAGSDDLMHVVPPAQRRAGSAADGSSAVAVRHACVQDAPLFFLARRRRSSPGRAREPQLLRRHSEANAPQSWNEGARRPKWEGRDATNLGGRPVCEGAGGVPRSSRYQVRCHWERRARTPCGRHTAPRAAG